MTVTRAGTVERLIDPRTVVVSVTRVVRHPKYGKVIRRRRTYLVDRPASLALALGQSVIIKSVRPISKQKHWQIVDIDDQHKTQNTKRKTSAATSSEGEAV